jgi:undecaprenyl diphosphate synthase
MASSSDPAAAPPYRRPPARHASGRLPPRFPYGAVPNHVAIVMDGNGRWATRRGMRRTAGHEVGVHSLIDVIDGSLEVGIRHLTAYAFSTENWRRDSGEVADILEIIRRVAVERREELHEKGVWMRWSGNYLGRLWPSVASELRATEELTAHNNALLLTMCVDYGGRAEIADAARRLARDAVSGVVAPELVDERAFAHYLQWPDMPDVDLFIRSSGEQRVSNFLLWQSAYAEMVFPETLWPDFDRLDLWKAIEVYASRKRRFGVASANRLMIPASEGAAT